MLMTPFDLKRLESYANNALDYHVVLDLLPSLASFYFDRRLGPDVRLSAVQSAILLGLGLQRKSVEDIEVCENASKFACRFDTFLLTTALNFNVFRKKSVSP